MENISSFFDSSPGELFRIAKAAQVVNVAQEVFDSQYAGVSHHVRVISCVGGALRVASASSAVMSDIVMRESQLIPQINERLSAPVVERIVCLVNDPSMR